jgi:hypothetical protein
MFQSLLVVSLLAATIALILLGPSHATQPDVYANPVIAQLAAKAEGDTRTTDKPVSPGIEGDHPGSMSTTPPAASSVEGSGKARADTTGDARRDTTGTARRDKAGDARRDTRGDALPDTPGSARP